MRERITVSLGSRSYDIHVGPGLIAEAGTLLAPLARGPVPVVTDSNVAPLYLQRFPRRASARPASLRNPGC